MNTKRLFIAILACATVFTVGCSKDDEPQRSNATIEDKLFKTYLLKHFDTNKDGEISASEAATVDTIDVTYLGINSLKGIEAFVNLKALYVCYNKLYTLDVSKNIALTELHCQYNHKPA